MNFKLEPNIGVSVIPSTENRDNLLSLRFGDERKRIRDLLSNYDLFWKEREPENDFYSSAGLILGYDSEDKLEFVEMFPPSNARFEDLDFFAMELSECLGEMNRRGYYSALDHSGYNFESIGIAFYCVSEKLESVSLYKEGYYDDL